MKQSDLSQVTGAKIAKLIEAASKSLESMPMDLPVREALALAHDVLKREQMKREVPARLMAAV